MMTLRHLYVDQQTTTAISFNIGLFYISWLQLKIKCLSTLLVYSCQTMMMTTLTSHILTRGIWSCVLSGYHNDVMPAHCTCTMNTWPMYCCIHTNIHTNTQSYIPRYWWIYYIMLLLGKIFYPTISWEIWACRTTYNMIGFSICEVFFREMVPSYWSISFSLETLSLYTCTCCTVLYTCMILIKRGYYFGSNSNDQQLM